MIDIYFSQLENNFQDFPLIRFYSLTKKRYNANYNLLRLKTQIGRRKLNIGIIIWTKNNI